MHALLVLLLIAWSTTASFAAANPDAPAASGAGTFTVPGTKPAAKIDYKVSVNGNPEKKTATMVLTLTNKNSTAIKFIVCAMLDLDKKPEKKLPKCTIKFIEGKWKCANVGMTAEPAPYNYHLGCTHVEVPASGSISVNFGPGRIKFSQDFKPEELGTLYMDFLADAPIDDASCKGCFGPDTFLVPEDPKQKDKWANTWVGGKYLKVPTDPNITVAFSTLTWPAGNWVTMGYPDTYPVNLRGTISGVPPGALFAFRFGTNAGGTYEAPPQGGLTTLTISERFELDMDMSAHDSLTVGLSRPAAAFIADQSRIAFHGIVQARGANAFYADGETMYSVDGFFTKDDNSPRLEYRSVQQENDGVRIQIEASDLTSYVTDAQLIYGANGEQEVAVPISPSEPAAEFAPQTTYFNDHLRGLEMGKPYRYHIDISDTFGNTFSSPPEELFLTGAAFQHVSFSGGFVQLVWTASEPGYFVESTATLGNASNWEIIPLSPQGNGNHFFLTVPGSSATRFFRLTHPEFTAN